MSIIKIKYFLAVIWEEMGHEFIMYGRSISIREIFIYGALGSILAGFVGALINNGWK